MIILTHRGLEPTHSHFYPESSGEAFEDQLKRGYGIEFDPNFVKDGIVVNHDSNLKRITNGKDERDFHDITVAEVISLRYRSKNGDGSPTKEGRMPTLDELLHMIDISSSQMHALHVKGKFQETVYLDRLISILAKYPQVLDRILIFDAKPQTAEYLRKHLASHVNNDQSKIHIAPSVSHSFDIKRFGNAVNDTLISIEEAIKYKIEGLYDWVWLDEWDLKDENNGHKTLYNAAVFEQLREVGYKISLVTPELHGTSPGLLGGEEHEDAASKKRLLERIRQIVSLYPDAICTDYPNEVASL